ncbi:hypothetical protein [Paenibacillus radicis (ex Xue et al. 2023)]|uniref:hypothetical protein n=1 Tax=Paenibacillus radicis (ex Xue et al. 2023) TaxID=2972489 RepID=UPI00280BB7D5|nr:hypothetical protein [Paenibacillus radicis (ex Xue et al. 2023)]
MFLQWEELEEPYRIKQTACYIQNGECTVTWAWPRGVESVYVYSFPDGAEQPPDLLEPKQLKLFTREEYKARSGYRERIEYLGVQGYRIFPCLMQAGKLRPLKQADAQNYARVSGGKAKIRYNIKYSHSWFSKYKTVRIQLFCEISVSKEALCYVKKEGSPPANKEDGIAYPFMSDFPSGRHILPEVEVGKNDYIRLFFTDGKAFGELYDLIPE